MKNLLLSLSSLLLLPFATADDFSFAHYGDAKARARLAPLEGKANTPDWTLTNWLNSKELKKEDLKGKIVILDFWATWCGSCLKAIDKNNEIHTKYKDDVVIIGICHKDGSELMAEMVKSEGIQYPVAIDPKNETIEKYKVLNYPSYYILDQEGVLVAADIWPEDVQKVVEMLLDK